MLNLSKIDERIRRLQELRRVVSDPEMLQLLRELVDASTDGDQPTEEVPAPSPGIASIAAAREPRMRRPKKGDLIKTVSRIVDALAGTYDFHAVVDRMKEASFRFVGEPEVAVSGALRKLLKKERIVVAEGGLGRIPNKYRTVAPSQVPPRP